MVKLVQAQVTKILIPYVTYIQMTNDITFEHIKNLNLPQQQSLDFPTVLSAISRGHHIIRKYANCSQQIHKYAKFSKQIHLIRAQLLTFPWNVQVGSHPLSLYTTRPPKQAGWECSECSTTGSGCMRWFPRNMHVSAPCAGVLRVQYNRAHNYALLPLAKVQALSEAQLPFYDLLWEAQGYFYCRRGERRDWCSVCRCLVVSIGASMAL